MAGPKVSFIRRFHCSALGDVNCFGCVFNCVLIMQKTKVSRLKELVEEKTGIEPKHQRLIYAGRQMEDKTVLADYALQNGSNIFLVLRLYGGSSGQATVRRVVPSSLPRSDDPCIITGENSRDDHVVVLKMPCGHPMSQDGLMDYAWSEVSTYKKAQVKCPLCSTDWPFGVIVRYGGATPTELMQLELGMSHNYFNKSNDINQCPRCRSYCTRDDSSISSVKCIVCTRKSRSDFIFCWHCLKEWKRRLPSSTCGNDGCDDSEKLAQLRDCGKTKVAYTNLEISKLRACPTCGTIIELAKGCKHMTCKMCKVEFCFICLRMKSNGSWQCGEYNTKCDPAPLQTVIPRRE